MTESLAYAADHPDEVRSVLTTYTKITPDVAAKPDPAEVAADDRQGVRADAHRPAPSADGLDRHLEAAPD